MLNVLSRFVRDDSGAAAVEYGLLVALIAAVLIVIIGALGINVQQLFVGVCGSISTAALAAGGAPAECAVQ